MSKFKRVEVLVVLEYSVADESDIHAICAEEVVDNFHKEILAIKERGGLTSENIPLNSVDSSLDGVSVV